MEGLVNRGFFAGKKVFVTGHTGFKGGWLCLWLHRLGAEVTGYALEPPTQPSLFAQARVGALLAADLRGDVRDLSHLRAALHAAAPELVFHLAAQPLVRESYRTPVETYATNVMGTVHLLEAVRHVPSVRAVVNVTSDKCYENREWPWGYREGEALGGYDPYASSKGCAELVTAAYRRSFFAPEAPAGHAAAVATARAGNVIGGGDWAAERLVPDCLRALLAGEEIVIRSPRAIRPWQHVLEPLAGYLLLAEKLYNEKSAYAAAWNFGPGDDDARPVEWLVARLCRLWGGAARYRLTDGAPLHEAQLLKLDSSRARGELGWRPRWNLEQALDRTVAWARALSAQQDLRAVTFAQIAAYQGEGDRDGQ